MDTIQIVSTVDGTITYTANDVIRFIDKAKRLRDTKHKVHNFFAELNWEDSEATITRSEVNELLESIECEIIRGEYKATVTITAYVTGYTAKDEDDAKECIADDISVSVGSSSTITIDNVEVDDVEEE